MRAIFTLLMVAIPALSLAGNISNYLKTNWIDVNADPNLDFYHYANGNWQKHHPIPQQYSSWTVFQELEKQNYEHIERQIETLEKSPLTLKDSERKIIAFYLSGINKAKRNALGIQPLQPLFRRIDAISNLDELQSSIEMLHKIGCNVLFNLSTMQEYKNSQKMIAVILQSGLGLPSPDYYFKKDSYFQKTRVAYLNYIHQLFFLMGYSIENADKAVAIVMKIENALAESFVPSKEQTPQGIYNPITLQELQDRFPQIHWQKYFSKMGLKKIAIINLANPAYFKALNKHLKNISLLEWKVYLRWQLIQHFSPYLSESFESAHFKMVASITGVKAPISEKEKIIRTVNEIFGDIFGEYYLKNYFQSHSKEYIEKMVASLRKTLKKNLQNNDWLALKTKKTALKKLAQLKFVIGCKPQIKDYSALRVNDDVYVLNKMRANLFLKQNALKQIDKPIANFCTLLPHSINAFYNPSRNRVEIPAGILQPPFFDLEAPPAINYGGIGFIIAHEMMHAFDAQGAQFNEKGNLENWWANTDLKRFNLLNEQIAKEFSMHVLQRGISIQGEMVVGEVFADRTGLRLAYEALQSESKEQHILTGGFTPTQQFFLNAAHIWAENITAREEIRLSLMDTHPPGFYRVNSMVQGMKEFALAFDH